MKDTIELSSIAADAINNLDLSCVGLHSQPETMAWVVLVLRQLEDRPEWFPRGKWATIQHIESQLTECAMERAREITCRV